ncbi:hypothetical protein DEJ00_08475 [Curtobacterium sp. MCLR17_039]|uniref:helix-turn-helix domain-containing protein n=1 Tax=Curtobacterium sp. MCLR17_039 TaxID=2175624 RepID=UPI000DAA3514|nr:hypothetical protein DEJ00_08475 [Curtobacterium sp. MCLR17_039]
MVVLAQVRTNTLTVASDSSRRKDDLPRPTRPRVTQEQQDEIVALYRSGLSTRAVAERAGVAKTTVLRALSLTNVGVRPRGGRSGS